MIHLRFSGSPSPAPPAVEEVEAVGTVAVAVPAAGDVWESSAETVARATEVMRRAFGVPAERVS